MARILLYHPPPPPPLYSPSPQQLLLISAASVSSILILLFFLLLFLYLRFSSPCRSSPASPSLRRFPYRLLRSSTSSFSPSRLLGRGASASVFLAVLPDGASVAVKSITAPSSLPDFHNELNILSSLPASPFILSLLGYSRQYNNPLKNNDSSNKRRRLFLVYEYMPNGSLQTALFRSETVLDWARRFQIILDVAGGVDFLHSHCRPPVVHGDIKPSNVLLGADFRAKIADFGLARTKPDSTDAADFSQDLGDADFTFDFDFSRAVRGSGSGARVRSNPIASLDHSSELKGKDATVAPLDDEVNEDWWWKQDESGDLSSRDYVSEWIGNQICPNPNSELDEAAEDSNKKKSGGGVKEWWKEEYVAEMSNKTKKSSNRNHLNWLQKSNRNDLNSDSSLPRGWMMRMKKKKKKRRSKSAGSDLLSGGDLFSRELSSTTTSVRGTICYVAPEHGGCGRLMEKGDIYSFGVLILVIVSGRRPLHILSSPMKLERANLVSWCRQLASSGNVLDLVDERLKGSYDKEQASLCVNLALLCLQRSPELRPESAEIVKILNGEMDLPAVPVESSPSPNSRRFAKSKRKTNQDVENV